MAEEMERTEFEYTYTYDQFIVFFYGDRVFIGRKDYPVGQCCVDILNLGETVLDKIDQRVREFIPAAENLLIEKRQRRGSRAGEAERCLGTYICFAGLPGFENGRALQLPHVPAAYGRQGEMGAGAGPNLRGLCQVPGNHDQADLFRGGTPQFPAVDQRNGGQIPRAAKAQKRFRLC